MKNVINHLLNNNEVEILKGSFLNCHIHGLHSLMLLDKPGCRIRMYIAEPHCNLSKCIPDLIKYNNPLYLGFHAHHCDLTFEVITGTLTNWKVFPSTFNGQISGFNSYKFKSPILEEKGGFELDKKEQIFITTDKIEVLSKGDVVSMNAKEIHTVGTNPFIPTAWLVYEGKEDESFEPLTFSNLDLCKETLDGLYIRPEPSDIERLIRISEIENYIKQIPIS